MIDSSLAAYLEDAAKRGYRLGVSDCCTFMADWLIRRGLPDVMADRRGSYATERDFRRMLRDEGGMVASCDRRFTNAGLAPAGSSRAGDVAVVMLPFAIRHGRRLRRPTGAIALSDRSFVVLLLAGQMAVVSQMPVAQIWSLHA